MTTLAQGPRRAISGVAPIALGLLLVTATSAVALDAAAVPEHQSHTVGWQEVHVFVQAKDDYEHGQAIPADFMAGREEAARIIDEYYQRFSYYRTGLRFTIFPYFVDNTSGQWQIVADAKTIDPDLDVSGADRIWNDSWQGGAGLAQQGGTLLRTGLGDHYPARHELAHTYGVGHPQFVSIGRQEGANTKIRWGWLTEDAASGYGYRLVSADGTYRIYDYGTADRLPTAVPGGHIALRLDTGDGPLAINNHSGKDRWAVFVGDDRVDLDPEREGAEFMGLAEGQIASYRYTDADGWRVDLQIVDTFPAADGKPRGADIAIAFPDGRKELLRILAPTFGETVIVGRSFDIDVEAYGMDRVVIERLPSSGDPEILATFDQPPYRYASTPDATGSHAFNVYGYVDDGGTLVERFKEFTFVTAEEPPDDRSRQVSLRVRPAPVDLLIEHLASEPVAGVPSDEAFLFEGLLPDLDHFFGFVPDGSG